MATESIETMVKRPQKTHQKKEAHNDCEDVADKFIKVK